ncbi:MAG: hypothetical protein WBP59_03550 [Ilumatobacteraceae bacterium]
MSQRTLFIGALAATASFLGACSSEEAAERLVEQQLAAEGIEDVEIDLDTGDVRIETEDGVFSTGSSADLPDDWPAGLPTPPGTLVNAARTEIDGAVTHTLAYRQPGEQTAAAYAALAAQLEGAGFTKSLESSTDGAVSAQFDDGTLLVTLFAGDNEGGTEFQYIVSPVVES